MKTLTSTALVLALCCALSEASAQVAFTYNNLTPNNQIAIATRPDSAGKFEIEAADDFLLTQATTINTASFMGLIAPTGGTVVGVTIEIYRVFPLDSSTVRTPQVLTRVNSPSDVAFDSRSSDDSTLTFTSALVSPSFTVLNSVQPGGIHPFPNQTTLGNGPLTGQEVQFNVTFTNPFTLPADHYFFVPQVQLSTGDFYWLSASRPISGAGTTPFAPDLQAWTRDVGLDPDWSRVGTDIVGGANPPTFNTAFSVSGVTIPAAAPKAP